ncbi:lasso peptide biosynthesis B2 protein [Sulfitobacter sp. JB4-11]|uniref:lasso peptide biosynthesis B2 protein n=1 Tax=Sulfitobacter rhodophyticola TaxID=3238304 RepID=UPI0035121C38
MKLFPRLFTLLRQGPARWVILLEALWALESAHRLVRRTIFIDYKDTLGRPVNGEVVPEKSTRQAVVHDIRWALTSIERSFFQRYTCLCQSIAAQRMFARRRIPYAVVLGAKLGATPDPRTQGDPMAAHAWVCAGGGVVVGEKERGMFVPVVSYVGNG